jgi:hypothetical protein
VGSGTAFCIVVLWATAAAVIEAPFSVALGLWFVGWLSAFHFYFAVNTKLTTTGVRLIDYFYVGSALAGVFSLGANLAEARGQFFFELNRPALETRAVAQRASLTLLVDEFTRKECQTDLFTRANVRCPSIRALAVALRGSGSNEDARKSLQFFRESISIYPRGEVVAWRGDTWFEFKRIAERQSGHALSDSEFRQIWLRADAQGRLFYKGDTIVMSSIDLEETLSELVPPGAKPAKEKSTGLPYNLYALGQLFLWPFVLALAAALRITKVTIEVFEWAVPASTIAYAPNAGGGEPSGSRAPNPPSPHECPGKTCPATSPGAA